MPPTITSTISLLKRLIRTFTPFISGLPNAPDQARLLAVTCIPLVIPVSEPVVVDRGICGQRDTVQINNPAVGSQNDVNPRPGPPFDIRSRFQSFRVV
jgi:hypothetical protein